MYIDHIKTFLEVASTGSFQLAAEKLFVTQSTVSARIKALEESLNRPLFIRKRNGIEMTSGGQRFHPHALTVIQAWARARQEVALPETLDSIVNLGIQMNHWEHFATPWLTWMEQHSPNNATQITAEYSEDLIRKVRNGVLELAIVSQIQQCPGITIERLFVESLVLVSTEPRKSTDAQVPGYIFVDWGETFKKEHSIAFPDTAAHRMTVGLAAVAFSHILKQGGSGYFIRSMVKELIDDKTIHLVEDAPVFEYPIYMVYQEGARNKDLVATAIKGLNEISESFNLYKYN